MDAFHAVVMDTYSTVCQVKKRLGGMYRNSCHVMDGQKYICMDELAEDIRNQECLIYSFGISNDWSFEDIIGSMGCRVYAFDPTIDHKPKRSENISFEKIGVVGKPTYDKSYKTLDQILKDNGHTNTKISYLKMDIEGHELSGLPLWLKSGALRNVQQIAMEVHLNSNPESDTKAFFQTFKDLHLQGNYRIFNWEANNCWTKSTIYHYLFEIVLKKINPTNLCSSWAKPRADQTLEQTVRIIISYSYSLMSIDEMFNPICSTVENLIIIFSPPFSSRILRFYFFFPWGRIRKLGRMPPRTKLTYLK